MKRRLLTLPLLAWALTPAIEAQPQTVYYGLSIGELDYTEDALARVFNGSASSWRATIGFQFLKHLAIEGTYGKTSTVRDTVSSEPPVSTELALETELDKLFGFRALGTVPFENGLSLLIGMGFVNFDQDSAFTVNGAPVFSGEVVHESVATFYFGAQYDWERVAVRVGYEKFDLDIRMDAEEAALSFFYKI
jgi:hypothetical protein